MGQIGDTWEETSGGYCSFTMKTKDMAKKVFEFLAINSDVEFSYAQLDKLFFIGTSKLKTKIIGGRTVVNNKLRGAKEVEFVHSHPYNHSLENEEIRNMPDAPSGFNTKSGLPNDDGGDRNNAESILKINPKAKFFVFSCLYSKKDRTSVYIQYNDKKFDYTRTKKYYDSKGSPTYYEYEM